MPAFIFVVVLFIVVVIVAVLMARKVFQNLPPPPLPSPPPEPKKKVCPSAREVLANLFRISTIRLLIPINADPLEIWKILQRARNADYGHRNFALEYHAVDMMTADEFFQLLGDFRLRILARWYHGGHCD
jgi:hypothetical protein